MNKERIANGVSIALAVAIISGMIWNIQRDKAQAPRPDMMHLEAMHSPPRSTHWPKVRATFLADHPSCAACGGSHDLEVHHKMPFHDKPELELDPKNLITLCRTHHLVFGHLMDWQSYNPHVDEDTEHYRKELEHRPAREKK